jgi:hypothetical protein
LKIEGKRGTEALVVGGWHVIRDFVFSSLVFLFPRGVIPLKKKPQFLGRKFDTWCFGKEGEVGFFIDFHACQHYFWFFLSWK